MISKEYRYYYELDFSGFDSSQGKLHFEIEQEWLKTAFNIFRERTHSFSNEELDILWKSFENQRFCNITFSNRKTRYAINLRYQYGRKSGDPNTSLGNTIINCVAFNSIPMFKNNTSTAFMLGDDNLFASNVDFREEEII